MFWVFLSFFFSRYAKRFLRVSFCTFRVLVRTTDVQRNATATTRFADGSWTPPKAAAATAAAARTQAIGKSFCGALASLSLFIPFSAICRALHSRSKSLHSLLLLSVAVVVTAAVASSASVRFSFLFCLPHSLTRLTTNEAAWRQHHKTYDFCQISGHAQTDRQLESV